MTQPKKPPARLPVGEPPTNEQIRERLEMLKSVGVRKASFYGGYLNEVEFEPPEPPKTEPETMATTEQVEDALERALSQMATRGARRDANSA